MSNSVGYLYRHIRLDKNEPFYIGISLNSNNYNQAGFYRAKSTKSRNKIWNGITERTDWEVEILMDNLPAEILKEKEVEFIKLYGKIYDKTGTLANLSSGGSGYISNSSNLGKRHSEETKRKMSLNRKNKHLNSNQHLKKVILQYDKDMNLITEHIGIRNLKVLGFEPSSVSKCCNGIRKSHKNFIWKYKNNIIL